jgi:hypothetical protein
MEKQTKTDLQLSEEHLQAITGGCAQCTSDRLSIGSLSTHTKRYDQAAKEALQAMRAGKTVAEIEAHGQIVRQNQIYAMENRSQITTLQQAIEARHP